MREIKFRAWNKNEDCFFYWDTSFAFGGTGKVWGEIEQYTGLKDKNGLTDIYEGDIIDSEGNIKGNIYENNLDKKETDTIIQGFGTKTWCETYRRAIFLGCKDSE